MNKMQSIILTSVISATIAGSVSYVAGSRLGQRYDIAISGEGFKVGLSIDDTSLIAGYGGKKEVSDLLLAETLGLLGDLHFPQYKSELATIEHQCTLLKAKLVSEKPLYSPK